MKRHQAVDDILKDMPDAAPAPDRGGARFLNRANALADKGEREEKTLRWVDPEDCVMWERHNRAYELLTPENCRDLIDSIRAQGRQEFPAVVRRRPGQGGYEVICGARRHFAISWLRANNYPQFRYLVEERELTDEEAFRLADIENRDREDLSDYERATDYAQALELYYGGRQKAMAARLEVSEAWLSRYLQLARLPSEIVEAFASLRDIKELHARILRPLLADPVVRPRLMAEAEALQLAQRLVPLPATEVLTRLKSAAKVRPLVTPAKRPAGAGFMVRSKRGVVTIEFGEDLPETELRAALETYLSMRFGPDDD